MKAWEAGTNVKRMIEILYRKRAWKIRERAAQPGAHIERPGAAWSVKVLFGGATSPGAFLSPGRLVN
jgi:hypothetical protein